MRNIVLAILMSLAATASYAQRVVPAELLGIRSNHTAVVVRTEFGNVYLTDLRADCTKYGDNGRVALVGSQRAKYCYSSFYTTDDFPLVLYSPQSRMQIERFENIRHSMFTNWKFRVDETLESEYKKDPQKVLNSL